MEQMGFEPMVIQYLIRLSHTPRFCYANKSLILRNLSSNGGAQALCFEEKIKRLDTSSAASYSFLQSTNSLEQMGDDLGWTPPSGASGSTSAFRGSGMPLEECELYIRRSLRTPMVKFLKEKLEKAGCIIGSNFIKATDCEQMAAGGFARGEGIIVCSNHVELEDDVQQVVIHELIHAYDDCRGANMDWNDCAHQACSEIRANHLSGDCHYRRELLRGHLMFRGHEQECVKRRSMRSVTANPYCSEVAAKEAIEAVWNTCYNDTTPFDRAP